MVEAQQVDGGAGGLATVVLEVSGVQWATEKARAESVLGRRPGVVSVDANPVAQTATVVFDPARASVAELAGWVRDCGFHCRGQSVPEHVCDPLAEPAGAGAPAGHAGAPAGHAGAPAGHAERVGRAEHAPAPGERRAAPEEVMGHGGHGEVSMAAWLVNRRTFDPSRLAT